jgi:two-component system nitrogen regulation response regulator GlnG
MTAEPTLKALVADDEPAVCEVAADLLRSEGLAVVTAGDGARAVELVESERCDVAILDVEMPRLDGIEALRRLRTTAPWVPVIMVTGHGDIRRAVEAMRLGAYDFLTKPLVAEDFIATVLRAAERQSLIGEVEALRRRVREGASLAELMGPSAAVQAVIDQVHQVARSTLSVVVGGETGTGKELVARAIHQQSERAARRLVALDCGAIPGTLIESELFGYEKGAFTGADRRKVGHFQLADGGTLFLDEVGNLPATTQAKLLRVLQERMVQPLGGTRPIAVDVRVIAASNVALDREVQAGRFREDLYYRLSEFTITLPPLRERPEDIGHLARRFLAEASVELARPPQSLAEDAVRALVDYPWPGNVRQLRNAIRRAALVGPALLRAEHLGLGGEPAEPPARPPAEATADGRSLRAIAESAVADAERHAIREALAAGGGNKSKAARALRTDYKTLHLKMKRYGIDARKF